MNKVIVMRLQPLFAHQFAGLDGAAQHIPRASSYHDVAGNQFVPKTKAIDRFRIPGYGSSDDRERLPTAFFEAAMRSVLRKNPEMQRWTGDRSLQGAMLWPILVRPSNIQQTPPAVLRIQTRTMHTLPLDGPKRAVLVAPWRRGASRGGQSIIDEQLKNLGFVQRGAWEDPMTGQLSHPLGLGLSLVGFEMDFGWRCERLPSR